MLVPTELRAIAFHNTRLALDSHERWIVHIWLIFVRKERSHVETIA